MYALEQYDPLAKRRAILNAAGNPVAWIDYDDVSREDADRVAEGMLRGLNDWQDRYEAGYKDGYEDGEYAATMDDWQGGC